MLTAFGRYIRKMRIDRGEILANMAQTLGVTSAYLSAVEHGKRKIPEKWYTTLIEAYDLSKAQQMELQEAINLGNNQVVIPLGMGSERDELVLSFARVFENCDKQTLSDLQSYLSKIDTGKKE